jgi:uncharacterized protein HemX
MQGYVNYKHTGTLKDVKTKTGGLDAPKQVQSLHFFIYQTKLVMKTIALIITLALGASFTSCGTSKGCNYQKAQKFNQKQMKKANRYYRHY